MGGPVVNGRPLTPWGLSAALGTLLGLLFLISFGAVMLLAASVGLLAWCTRGDRRLFRLACVALMVRWLLLVGVTTTQSVTHRTYASGSDTAFALFGDEGYYTIRGLWLLKRVLGQPMEAEDREAITKEFQNDRYGRSGHLYAVAFFYHLFGYSPTAVKGLSILAMVLAGLCVHDLVRRMADARAARLAALLIWWWPSMMLWSITNLKDPYAIFLMCLAVWAFQRWLDRPRQLLFLGTAAAALYAHASIKDYLWIVLAGMMGVAALLRLRPRWLRAAALAGLLAASVGLAVARWPQIDARLKPALQRAAMFHIHHAIQTVELSKGYRLLPDDYYIPPITEVSVSTLTYADLAWLVLGGAAMFLLVPFPLAEPSRWHLAVLPQMLCWYGILLAAIGGLAWALRHRRQAVWLPWLILSGLTGMLGMTSGNIGTTFRHRDLVTPLYLLFAGIGLSWLVRRWRSRASRINTSEVA
jgi:hypothetical protein